VSVRNNVLELNDNGLSFNYGMAIRSVDNVEINCSGNRLEGDYLGEYFSESANGVTPIDTLTGHLVLPTSGLYYLNSADAYAQTTSGRESPLYGTNQSVFWDGRSSDVYASNAARNVTGDTTPNVDKGMYFYTQNTGAVSINDFDTTDNLSFREVNIVIHDENTTISPKNKSHGVSW